MSTLTKGVVRMDLEALSIDTQALLERAIEIERPLMRPIILDNTAGPTWVNYEFQVEGMEEPLTGIFGTVNKWDPAWGKGDEPLPFDEFAGRKRRTARYHETNSGYVPEEELVDDQINWAGGVWREFGDGGVSGIMSHADEYIAERVLSRYQMLLRLAILEAEAQEAAASEASTED